MNPEQQNTNQNQQQPQVSVGFINRKADTPPVSTSTAAGDSSNKKKVIIAAAGAVVFILILAISAVVLTGSTKEAPQEQPQAVAPQGPQPATNASVEQANNSITQDLSSIDDATDFPEDQLSDDNLNL